MREYANVPAIPREFTLSFDVVIVGFGAAGLYTALNLDPGQRIAILDKLGQRESNSYYAQGGIAAVTSLPDNWESHLEDTMTAGAGLCDRAAVEVLVREGADNIRQLIEWGVPFDRDEKNKVKSCMEGAHSHARILHCGGDATGLHLVKALADKIDSRPDITCFSYVTLIDVLTDDHGAVNGALVSDVSGQFFAIHASTVVLASGGIGRLYRNSTNSACATGDGIAAAIRAGARIRDMEFVQFHPTALIHPDQNMRFFLISEALRGEGAVLRNRRWDSFMKGVHPKADLAPRDIVSRAIVNEMLKFDLPNVYLDITAKPRAFLRERFPVIYEECMRRGIDIAVNWIPVMPVQHYFMGGIQTDIDGQTSISGLYACGETASTGIHGANRLASNSLLECVVFGRRCARSINGRTTSEAKEKPRFLIESQPVPVNTPSFDFETSRSMMRNTMTLKGGIIRNESGLTEAIEQISDIYAQVSQRMLKDRLALETLNMALVAKEILQAARSRKKSVGAHFREDDVS